MEAGTCRRIRSGAFAPLASSPCWGRSVNQDVGIAPDDERVEPYRALAEELGIGLDREGGVRRWMIQLLPHIEPHTFMETAARRDVGVVGQLTFAGTLPEHRRRGAQSALVARGAEDARAAGAQWIVSEPDEELPERPNPSPRDLVRLGFPVAYIRANWGPPKPRD